jgi:hypothetical protein
MTEAEWLTCSHPMLLVNYLEARDRRWSRRLLRWVYTRLPLPIDRDQACGRNPNRRAYLCALGARIHTGARRLGVPRSEIYRADTRRTIEERFAEGLVTLDELLADNPERRWHWPDPWHLLSNVVRGGWEPCSYEEINHLHCQVIRDVFGNPFARLPHLDSGWLRWSDSLIPKLARSCYEERTFDRLPILADALEDAGCTDADMLAHLRGPGPHVRGCWALDLILGKN